MIDIFVSWGSPDSAVVKPLRDRLRDLGLDVWEYSEDMSAGDQIQPRVMKVIGNSRIAVLCLSNATVEREWVMNEIAACVYAREQGDIEYIIPVKVGALDNDKFPLALTNLNLNIFDLSTPARMNDNLENFVDDIYEKLGLRAPVIMPAAIFAMTNKESLKLFEEWLATYKKIQEAQKKAKQAAEETQQQVAPEEPAEEQEPEMPQEQERFWKLCKDIGMQEPPELFGFLQNRYGENPWELMPFVSDKKIIDVINEILRQVNKARLSENPPHRPIFLRWVTDKVFTNQSERDWWRSRDSLLIIDSVSTFYNPIRLKLTTVPAQRTALLWLPPYTQHTASLEEALRSSAQFIPSLGDEFSDWGKHPKRSISFDTSTSLALQVWLRRALFQVGDEPGALKENVEAFSSANKPPGNPGAAIFGKGSPR